MFFFANVHDCILVIARKTPNIQAAPLKHWLERFAITIQTMHSRCRACYNKLVVSSGCD